MGEYLGVWDDGRFEAIGQAPSPKRRMVKLHIEDEAISANDPFDFTPLNDEMAAKQLAAVEEFLAAICEAEDEAVPKFERANLSREVQV